MLFEGHTVEAIRRSSELLKNLIMEIIGEKKDLGEKLLKSGEKQLDKFPL